MVTFFKLLIYVLVAMVLAEFAYITEVRNHGWFAL